VNGRQKIEAAFSREGSPEFAAVICYEGIYVRDHWSGLTHYPWWFEQSPDLAERMACLGEIIPAIGQDWMDLSQCPSRRYRQQHCIEARPEGVFLVGPSTGEDLALQEPTIGGWELVERGYSGHVEPLAETFDEVDLAIPPTPSFDRSSFEAEGYADLARLQLAAFGEDHYPLESVSTPFWACYGLWGFEGMMAMVARRPDLVRYACDRFLIYSLQRLQQSAALGAAGIWVEDCMSDMISPAAFAELNAPYVRRIVEEIRSLGMHSIYYYCGNPMDRLNLLLEVGADALALEESKKGFTIDIAGVAEVVQGRCALLGNLDAINLLPHASADELRGEISRQVAAGRRNKDRFVMSLGSPVTPGTTPERVREYCNWARELGR